MSDPTPPLLKLIQQLEAAGIHHSLAKYRYDAISIIANVPGEYWEIDITEDGEIEFERFRSNGEIEDEKALADSIRRFAE